MRASDFIGGGQGMTISIPINITIPANGGMPVVGTIAAPAGDEKPDQAMMIPPLQQQLELLKQQGGKESPVINQIINQDPESPDDFVNKETERSDQDFENHVMNVRDENESDQVLDLIKRRKLRLDQM